jgi:hypothetical protein
MTIKRGDTVAIIGTVEALGKDKPRSRVRFKGESGARSPWIPNNQLVQPLGPEIEDYVRDLEEWAEDETVAKGKRQAYAGVATDLRAILEDA